MALDAVIRPKAAELKIRALVKSFGAVTILRSVDIEMAPGDFLVLVGPSGCGKSTLLNCIAGLEESTSGTIWIGGRDVTGVPPRDRDIAMVFQSYALYPTMSVAENIGFGMKIRGLARPQIDARVAEVAKLLQIDHLLDRRPSQLSGGQRQRVAMGRALVREPALFLFDEPLSNLDAKLRVEMRAEIKRFHKVTGASIVYVTHDQIEAMTLATRIVVLKDGMVQQIGTPKDIYETPANMFVADFMGSPPMNLVPAVMGADRASVAFGPGQVLAGVTPPDGLLAGAPVIVGIRPEHFTPGTAPGALAVTTKLVENAGSDAYLTFDLGPKQVTARLPGRFDGAEGAELRLSVNPADLVWFDPASGLRLPGAVVRGGGAAGGPHWSGR